MFKLTTPTVLAAVLAVCAAVPSFAWGWGIGGNKYEVAGRDAHLNREIAADRGHLGGHYGQLRHEDAIIRNQEHRDLCRNGGYLTSGQTRRLNVEENMVQRQINNDHFRSW